MRAGTFCCVVSFAIFLALPETTGAPTNDSPKSDQVLSHTIQKESSKSKARSLEEDVEAKESQTRTSNGLVSGAKSMSATRQLTESEEEQSRRAEEKKTTTGSEKVEDSLKKKKLVTVNEKKSILIYYLVSYKKLPAKRSSESRVDYYKRIFPKEDNLNVFYRKIFKAYEGEEPQAYIERVEFILTYVYPELDCRLDVKWLEQFDHYYTLKYSRKLDEKDECYFPRILKKFDGETKEHYKLRMECLVAALDEEDFNHITFDDSELGYKIGIRKTPAKSVSSPSSSAQKTGQISSSSMKSRELAEVVDESENSVEQTNQKGSSAEYQKNLKKVKTSVEKEENVKSFAYRVAYTALPKRKDGQTDMEYYKNFFGEYNSKMSVDTRNELYLRILIQYKGEKVEDYVKRIDFLFDRVYPELDIRCNKLVLNLLEHYYKEKYSRLKGETEEQCFARMLTKQAGETVEHYLNRVDCLQTILKDVNWSKVIIDENSTTGYRLASAQKSVNEVKTSEKSSSNTRSMDESETSISKQKSSTGVLTEEEIKKTYAKTETEDITSYFKRIVTKSSLVKTTEEYTNLLTSVRKCYPDLLLWYDEKYIDSVKDYYTALYTKQSSETEETYFQRIVTKESFESEEQNIQRIHIVHQLLPNLALWSDDTYYEKFTKKFYETFYKKSVSEDITTYYQRITSRLTEESDTFYFKRLTLIKRTTSNLDLWYCKKYLNLTKTFYFALYRKQTSETEESLFTRIVTKEIGETDEQWAQRVEIVQELFSNLPLWFDKRYYQSFTKKVYQILYKKTEIEDLPTYYSRITTRFSEETDTVYINRMSLVKQTFNALDLWYLKKYLYISKKYYNIKYSKQSSESDETLCTRIATKEEGETEEQWALRVEMIQELFPNHLIWSDEKYYGTFTKKIYQTFYKKSTTEDVTSYYKRLTIQVAQESDTVYVNRLSLIKQTYNTLDLWYSKKFLEMTRKFYILKYSKQSSESDETLYTRIVTKEECETEEQWAQRVKLIQELFPNLLLWSDDKYYENFTKKIYQTFYKKSTTEDVSSYYKRLTTQVAQESDTVYVNRLSLIKQTYISLDLWYSKIYSDTIRKFYTVKYNKQSYETEETQYTRIVTKDVGETDEQCAQRVEVLQELVPNLQLWSGQKYYEKFTKIVYQTLYKKSSIEDVSSYYKRLTTQIVQESETDYINRVSLIKQTYSTLDLWYSKKYINIIKKFYTQKYCKQSSETEESLYKRIITKEVGETDEQCAQRVEVLREILPNLSLWSDEKYYESFLKNIYLIIYKKLAHEDDTTYFQRICAKSAIESDLSYLGRMNLIMKTFNSLPLWYSASYTSILKPFYTLKYTKLSGEPDDTYFTRILAKDTCDLSDDSYAQRIHLIHLLNPHNALWYNEKYIRSYYSIFYKKGVTENCDGWLTRVLRVLPGESEENAFRRIQILKKNTLRCGCWTPEILSRLESTKCFSSAYISRIRKTFFVRLLSRGLLKKKCCRRH